eukprot:scaffold102073_cov45-Attheya_sp.AAC.2
MVFPLPAYSTPFAVRLPSLVIRLLPLIASDLSDRVERERGLKSILVSRLPVWLESDWEFAPKARGVTVCHCRPRWKLKVEVKWRQETADISRHPARQPDARRSTLPVTPAAAAAQPNGKKPRIDLETLLQNQQAAQKQQHAINERVEAAQERQQAAQEQQQAIIAQLLQAKSHKGVTTNATFYDSLTSNELIQAASGSHCAWDNKEDDLWFDANLLTVAGTSEEHVQDAFEKIIARINDQVNTGERKAKSLPTPDSYKKRSFKTRKPDVVNRQCGTTGLLGISAFGDLKKVGSNDFSSDEQGHVLDMATTFMDANIFRPFVIVFLSDGTRWQFYRVVREDKEKLMIYASTVINEAEEGWKHYLALLSNDLTELGHWVPRVCNVTLEEPLGRGMSCMVYKGKHTPDAGDVLVKLYFEQTSYNTEKAALQTLGQVSGVPRIVAGEAEVENALDSVTVGLHKFALIITPIGIEISKDGEKNCIKGTHLKDLVGIVKQAHLNGLIHRDIKPRNVFFTPSDNTILLIDWGSSTPETNDEARTWEGTVGFSVHPTEDCYNNLDSRARDLVSIVRTSYSLLFKENVPSIDPKVVENHWRERLCDESTSYKGPVAEVTVNGRKGRCDNSRGTSSLLDTEAEFSTFVSKRIPGPRTRKAVRLETK